MPVQVVLVIVIAAVFAAIVLSRQARAWWRFRGQRVIECPETRKPAGVRLDVRHAAATSIVGQAELRLSACTRWPERAGCGRECLAQIAEAPEDCLVRTILANWYQGKSCASCGQPFEHIEWTAAKPALLQPGGISAGWDEIPPERLYETLAAAQPVCFACHTAMTLVRTRPDLVTDRSIRPHGA